MKEFTKYLLIILMSFTAVGCEDVNDIITPDNNEEIVIPEFGYIYFNGETTRGSLYESNDDLLKADFGVIGYTYSYDNWIAAEPQAKPNVFYNNTSLIHPQLVRWSDEVHSYSPMQEWQGNQLYSFFAFYPNNLTISSNNYEGNPYIDFTFSRGNLANQVDVMTAQVLDVDYRSRSVGFEMKHRLTAIDVVGNNLYENIDGIKITSMSISFTNLLYDEVQIPLNMRDEPELVYVSGLANKNNRSASYNLLSSGTLTIGTQTNTPLTSGKGTTMIIIPQKQYIDTNGDNVEENYTLSGTVNIAYQTLNGEDVVETVGSKGYNFTINRDLVSGHRYYIQLNFAAGDVTIAILESDMWDELDINYEFE